MGRPTDPPTETRRDETKRDETRRDDAKGKINENPRKKQGKSKKLKDQGKSKKIIGNANEMIEQLRNFIEK